jgi:uncharacterized membrane protein
MTPFPRGAWPVLLAGVGLGGFVDGIVLHQVLQWHHLVSAYEPAGDVAGLETNTFWDGVFHLATWLVTLVALVWTARRGDDVRALGGRALTGLLLAGWGAFNLTDQVVFHLALRAHHIRMVEDYQVYDWSFAAFGALLVAVGWRLARRLA